MSAGTVAFVPFAPEHLDRFRPDPAIPAGLAELHAADLGRLVNGYAWSAFDGAVPVACGGLQPVWRGRAVAWALLSPAIGPRRFVAVDRRVRRGLSAAQAAGIRRIEAVVDPVYRGGRALRWALGLGFRPEGLMRRWTRDGRDMWLVAITGEDA